MSETAEGSTPLSDGIDPGAWKVIAVVLLGPLMAQMDSTIVNVSLSNIRDSLHASIASAQWIISGYLLALALMLPLNSWIVDRLGAKKLYLWCFSLFTLTSALCGAAHTIDQLICARLLQGIAGGLLAPLTQMMIARVAGRHMARVIGYAATPILLAPTFGPVIAGAILKYATWPWLFFVNLPLGIIACTLAVFLLPRDEPSSQRRPFDALGFLAISPGLACFLYGIEQTAHHEGNGFLILGILLLVVFVLHSRRKKSAALIDLELFKNRIFTTAALSQFITNGLIYSGQFLIPLYLIQGCGMSAGTVGWMLAPTGVGMMFVYPFMGALTDRFGCRAVSVGGAILSILGTIPFVFMIQGRFSVPVIIVSLLARGVGQGAVGVPTIAAAYASVEKEKLGLATTAINIVQRLGGPIATTALALIVSATTTKIGLPESTGSEGFFIPFIALIFLQILSVGMASRLPVRIHQQKESSK
jgi:EmrB/QacA subfamily drug resistance transporter